MVKKLKTYLAGAFCPSRGYLDWRDFVIERINNNKISFYDPRIESNQLCPATFSMDDAKGVINPDIFFIME